MTDLLGGLINGPMAVRTSEGIAHVVRQAILAGRLMPGTELPERKLADELSVSRTPVREALFVLQGEGLIDLIPGRCARVREVSTEEIEEIFVLRRLLETHAVKRAAKLRNASKIKSIEDTLAAQKRLGQSGSVLEQAQADLAFHKAVAEAAGSQLLVTLVCRVFAITVTYRFAYKYSAPRTSRVFKQHSAIFDAIKSGNGSEAESLMSQHIKESSELVLKNVLGNQANTEKLRENVG
ncbi:GntR family transcriptional regulator [Hyphomicrobium sp. 99]|uniref:GntR family transcriptional regulator n=1 Tax=Hyphomicrobium sp. 99 TaxID=1163419 RepID=UPI0006961C9F|nr:GntR family transcriptional regulator [Hyphomicrobium sp. 99]